MKKKIILRAVFLPIISLIVVGFLVGTIICGLNASIITANICPPIENQSALNSTREAGKELAEQISQEGIVMVQNNESLLPLSSKEVDKVNVFGRASTDWLPSGSGSGQVSPETKDSKPIDVLNALKNYGIKYNEELEKMYKNFQQPYGYGKSLGENYTNYFRLSEPEITDRSVYTNNILENAKEYSNTALVVLSRRAGESEDPVKYQVKINKPTDNDRIYLEISTEEESLLKYVGENYKNVIVIINSTNAMELGFLKTIKGLDSCLVVGTLGNFGANAIPKIIFGDVSPSGKLVDTYAYKFNTNVNYNYTGREGVKYYTNQGLFPTGTSCNSGPTKFPGQGYIDYIEGIYVGYRWYETADVEGIWDDVDNEYGKGYNGVVQYPFGYGLSYTSFDWKVSEISPSNKNDITENTVVNISIVVTNVGTTLGKDIVELYLTPPYTKGGIEKSSVKLLDYAKTTDLEPGESQLVTLSFKGSDLASYDDYDKNNDGFKGYEIDAGEYQIKLMTDSHNIKNVAFSGNNKKEEGVIKYNINNTIKIETDPISGHKVENLFTGENAVDELALDGSNSLVNPDTDAIPYISRNSFPKNPLARKAARKLNDLGVQKNLWAGSQGTDTTNADNWNKATIDEFGDPVNVSPVTWGKNNNLKIGKNGVPTELGYELAKNYDDPRWDDVLDEITIQEVVDLPDGAYAHGAFDSIGKPSLKDIDGPIQVKGFTNVPRGTGMPSAFVVAQTWSKKLAYDFGLNMGKEISALGYDGICGPALNIHRSPLQGRNYEYYSEDPYIAGTFAANVTRGIQNTGKYVTLKHFALNNVENNRRTLATWLSEQTFREIYLKGFQLGVQQGGAMCIMSSYNRVGGVWAGGSTALLTGIARNEWGFKGGICTDYNEDNIYMNIDQAIRAGGNLGMHTGKLKFDYVNCGDRMHNQLRSAAKEATYMWLRVKYLNQQYNENIDEGEKIISVSSTPSWTWWIPTLIDVDIIVGCIAAFGIYLLFKKDKKSFETNNNKE